jgi:outer membrane protein
MKKNIILVFITVVVCSAIFLFIGKSMQKGKTAWIDINKVYNEFVYKKELEKKLTQTQQARKALIDSLEFELQMLSREIQTENGKDKNKISVFEFKRENYLNKKNEAEQDNAVLQKTYNTQILNQLNQYLKDYGKKENLRYILGSDGSGALMFATEEDEITEAAILYINERYKGKTEE